MNQFPKPSNDSAPERRKGSLLLVLLGTNLLLISLLSTHLLVNKVLPEFFVRRFTPLQLEAEFTRLLSRGSADEALALANSQFGRIPNLVEAARHYRESSPEVYRDYIERHGRSIAPFQDLAFVSLQVFRRYNAPREFESYFSVLSDVDPDSEIGKVARLLRDVEATRDSGRFTPEDIQTLRVKFDELVKGKDDSQLFRYFAAVHYNNHGYWESAKHHYDRLVREWPVGPILMRRDYGDLLSKDSFTYDAYLYRKATVDLAPTGEDYYKLARSLSGLMRRADAIVAYTKATELEPTSAEFQAGLSNGFLKAGDFEEAIEAARHATEIDPKEAFTWVAWANALEATDRPEEALAVLREGLTHAKDPQNFFSRVEKLQWIESPRIPHSRQGKLLPHAQYMTRSQFLEKQFLQLLNEGDQIVATRIVDLEYAKIKTFQRTLHHYRGLNRERFLEYVKTHRELLQRQCEVAFLYAVDRRAHFDIPTSTRLFEAIHEISPESEVGGFSQIIASLDTAAKEPNAYTREEIENLFSQLRESVSARLVSPLQLWLAGILCRTHERPEEGVEYYERLTEYWLPGPALMHQTYANHLDELERSSEALSLRRLSLTLEHGEWAEQGTGHTLEHLFRYQEAQESFQIAVEMSPKNSSYWLSWGHSLMQNGKHEEAIPKFKQALRLSLRNENAWINWARSLCALDSPSEAYRVLSVAKMSLPDSQKIENAHKRLANYATDHAPPLTLEEATSPNTPLPPQETVPK